MLGVVPNAYAKFQKNSINNESGKNTWYEGCLCPILPITCIAGPGMNPRHVDAILVKNYSANSSETS